MMAAHRISGSVPVNFPEVTVQLWCQRDEAGSVSDCYDVFDIIKCIIMTLKTDWMHGKTVNKYTHKMHINDQNKSIFEKKEKIESSLYTF